MENYPTEIQEAVKIMYEMRGNSEGMMTWKNFPLAKQIITLLDSIFFILLYNHIRWNPNHLAC